MAKKYSYDDLLLFYLGGGEKMKTIEDKIMVTLGFYFQIVINEHVF